MFIRIFVQAVDTEEAIKHTKKFESLISNSVIGLKIEKIEQYWKIPEQYCIEYEFKDIIPERIFEVIKHIGNNPYTTANGDKIEEYIFARTTGDIYLEKIEWLLINIGK